jgi:hypothetical protein
LTPRVISIAYRGEFENYILAALLLAGMTTGPVPACLEGFVNQFLDELVAHDPSKLPLSEERPLYRKWQELKLGDGMWGPTRRARWASSAPFSNKKISDLEVVGLRKTQNLVDKPLFHQALTPSERRPRAELIRVANTYFEGMEARTDKNTPFD